MRSALPTLEGGAAAGCGMERRPANNGAALGAYAGDAAARTVQLMHDRTGKSPYATRAIELASTK